MAKISWNFFLKEWELERFLLGASSGNKGLGARKVKSNENGHIIQIV